MKKILRAFGWMLISMASIAYAAPEGGSGGGSLLGYLFMGFFTLIIVSQFVPACLLFHGMIKGVLGGEHKDEAGAHGN